MAIIKRYQLLRGMQLLTNFKVEGKVVCITFGGGIRRPYLIRGRFTTSDEDLQKAIEKSNGFGLDYYIEDTIYTDPVIDDTPVFTKVDPSTDPVDYPDVLTVGDARKKLIELYPEELKPKDLPNKIAVLARSKDKNITFSKLA